jgi:hypothetical protein
MTSVISFSLYGNNPLYCIGAIENARLCALAYPGWEVRIYAHLSVDPATISALISHGARIFTVDESHADERETIAKCTFWRFRALDDPTVERAVFRDCDSRASDKESKAVQAWGDSGKTFHFMYDHPYHATTIMAGMWGGLRGAVPSMKDLVEDYFVKFDAIYAFDRYYDQHFLRDVIWTKYVKTDNYVAHGNYEMCSYHREQGIKVIPYPQHTGFYPMDSEIQSFIGQTILCPDARPKPPRRQT